VRNVTRTVVDAATTHVCPTAPTHPDPVRRPSNTTSTRAILSLSRCIRCRGLPLKSGSSQLARVQEDTGWNRSGLDAWSSSTLAGGGNEAPLGRHPHPFKLGGAASAQRPCRSHYVPRSIGIGFSLIPWRMRDILGLRGRSTHWRSLRSSSRGRAASRTPRSAEHSHAAMRAEFVDHADASSFAESHELLAHDLHGTGAQSRLAISHCAARDPVTPEKISSKVPMCASIAVLFLGHMSRPQSTGAGGTHHRAQRFSRSRNRELLRSRSARLEPSGRSRSAHVGSFRARLTSALDGHDLWRQPRRPDRENHMAGKARIVRAREVALPESSGRVSPSSPERRALPPLICVAGS